MAKKKRVSSRQRAEERRQKRVRMWMGGFIIAIMVLSSLAFVMVFHAPNNGAQSFGNYEIRDNQIIMDLDGQEVHFYSFPDPTIEIPPAAIEAIQQASTVITTFDPEDQENLPYIEAVRWDFSQYIQKTHGGAVLSETDQYRYPVMGCEVATPENPVIQIINGTGYVTEENGCITIVGNQQSLLQIRDQFLYAYFGVQY